ncbi:MAG TPA: YgaP-like transmembrane domain [Myxococcaceae bacterium]|nr:YgaP-like transmembrane domain [Myxococcaceae bacterium]
MAFAEFMGSPLGRGLRVVFGGLLIWVGLNVLGGTAGTVVALLGIVPIATGLLNICILGPLLGAPLRGSSRPAPKA